MNKSYSHLFEPVSIGKLELPNRIAMAPIGIWGLCNRDGSLSQRAIDYYLTMARGGVGLIITSFFKVENEVEELKVSMVISDAMSASLSELCEAIHPLGTKIFVQLSAGLGRNVRLDLLRGKPVAPSALPHFWRPDVTCRAVTTDEVENIVSAFGKAAEIIAAAGVDGIEVHGHEGYLLDEFTTAIWNRRSDKYGGDLSGRMTLPAEILREIRKKLGNNFPVQYRFGLKHFLNSANNGTLNPDEFPESGRDIAEGLEIARRLQEMGYDSLHVDVGCYESWYWAHPPLYQDYGCMADYAGKVKETVNIPVIAVGRLDKPDVAEAVITEGKADIVAIGRGLFADPEWPHKVHEGRIEDIRPCLGCHDGCIQRSRLMGKSPSCTVNPTVGREMLYRLEPALKSRKVLVIGGGVAGMEAARVACTRGHEVILYEKGKELGGHLLEASVPDFKRDVRRLLEWYRRQMDQLGVKVRLGTEADESVIAGEKPEAVLVATGSRAAVPDIPGINHSMVVASGDLLLGHRKAGGTVAVLGGGLIGCETALWLARQGHSVTIVERLPELMSGGIVVPHMNRTMLLDLLARHKVNIMTGVNPLEINDEGVLVIDGKLQRSTVKADTVALSVGMKAINDLYRALLPGTARLYAMGDCREPRNIMAAIWDAYEVARTV